MESKLYNKLKPYVISSKDLFEHVDIIINYHTELHELYGDDIADFHLEYVKNQLALHKQASSLQTSTLTRPIVRESN
jgi:hypothetical protein